MRKTATKERKPEKYHGLCHRCEHRAVFHEMGFQPRWECGDTQHAVVCCYMYRPVRPVLMSKQKGDRRPIGAPGMIAARMVGRILAKGEAVLSKRGKYWLFWFRPRLSADGAGTETTRKGPACRQAGRKS